MSTAVATIKPRLALPPSVVTEFGLSESQWRVLVETTYPLAKSPEAVAMAIAYCNQRGLDVFKKPIHIVPMWNSALRKEVETIWPGIAEIRTTAARTGLYAGIDPVAFGPQITKKFTGETGRDNERRSITKEVTFPEWVDVTVYRLVHGQRCAFTARVFWEETYATVGKSNVPNDMWEKRPRGQLSKCGEAAALRMAFPEELGSVYVAEEMEGKTIDPGEMKDITPPPPPPDPPPAPAAEKEEPKKPAEPTFDGDATVSELRKAATAAATMDELKLVRDWLNGRWKMLTKEQQGAASTVLMSRKAEIEKPAPDTDAAPFDLDAFVADLDARATPLTDFPPLDALWEEVERANEAGLISSTEKERIGVEVFEKHQKRIDDIFPMDRGG